MRKNAVFHWGGGLQYVNGKKTHCHGRGYPCCCSGDRAYAIRDNGTQVFDDDDANLVTCKRCRELMARRVRPGPIGRALGIPDIPDPRIEA